MRRRHNGAGWDVYRRETKKKNGAKKTHGAKAPFHVFVFTNKWWIVPQAKVFFLELKSRGKSTWQSGGMECER